MGRVTFNGNVATPESQVFIRSQENAILASGGDEFLRARRIEQLYRENGLEPGTFYRAGALDLGGSTSPQVSAGGFSIGLGDTLGGLLVQGIRWCVGFVLVFFALAWMNNFGVRTDEEKAEDAWLKCEKTRKMDEPSCGPRPKVHRR